MASIAGTPNGAPATPAARNAKSCEVKFASFDVTDQVFYRSADDSCLGIVNLKPIVPGHVLMIPTRPYHRFAEIPTELVASLFQSVQEVSKGLEQVFEADAITVTIQDGEAAGQTVPHLHVHILPRKMGDIEPKDLIYEHLEKWEFDLKKLMKKADEKEAKFKIDSSEDRKPRSKEAMRREAAFLSSFFTAQGAYDAQRFAAVSSNKSE